MRVALLGSGRGSNADAVLRAQAEGRLGKAKVVGIWCDVPTCKMLELGPKYGVPARFLDTGPFKTKFSPEREQAWADALKAAQVDLVVLAGFMRSLGESNLHKLPAVGSVERGRAWPSPRTWDFAARAIATCLALDASASMTLWKSTPEKALISVYAIRATIATIASGVNTYTDPTSGGLRPDQRLDRKSVV